MCYTKKLTKYNGQDLGPKFAGRFECNKFNCTENGCNEGLEDGDQPKRIHDLTFFSSSLLTVFFCSLIVCYNSKKSFEQISVSTDSTTRFWWFRRGLRRISSWKKTGVQANTTQGK